MKSPPDLRALAADAATAPFDFETFELRWQRARRRGRVAGWGAVAALAVLTSVPLLALLTRPEPAAHVLTPPASAITPSAEMFVQPPALVAMDRFVLTSELEDHIAMLDAEISVARLTPVPSEQLRRMEATRAQLNDSLVRVAHAHALLDL